MPFIGNQLSTSFQNVETQTITGDGSTAYTLNNAVADGKDLLVYINNVKQEEGSGKSYTATGTTITFSDAVASTDSCYVVFIGQAIGTVTPKDGSIVSSMLADANLEMPNTLDLNGKELILDADADTSITADTDDQIDIKIAGSDNLRIKANEIENVSGDFTLDVAGDIKLDADGSEIFFADGGTDFLKIQNDSGTAQIRSLVSDGDISFIGNDGGSNIEVARFDMSAGGRFGIGTTSPNAKLSLSGTGTVDLGIGSTNAGGAYLYLDGDSNGDFSGSDYSYIGHDTSGQLLIHQDSPSGSDNIIFSTTATERMRIDSSGNVGINSTSPSTYVDGSSGSTLVLESSGTNRGALVFASECTGGENEILGLINFTDTANSSTNKRGAAIRGIRGSSDTNPFLTFTTADTERMRIDSSGNFLINTTDTSLYNDTSGGGFAYRPGNELTISSENDPKLILNDTGSANGEMIRFQEDGNSRAFIGLNAADPFIARASGNGMRWFSGGLHPCDQSGATADNVVSLGTSTGRFDDAFITNGVTTGSDQNEKQNIESLTAKELNVANKLSALFKTYRWKDAVTEKGDKARTHTGIVAQEIQSAFSAEGLDASNYGMFMSDTWTNDDGKEQTRLGVRYPELFSFIFSSIEARLTALEAK